MPTAPVPADEEERLAELHRYAILDTPREQSFDELTYLAAYIVRAPVSLISLVDEHRLWFKSQYGFNLTELPREGAFCNQAIAQKEPLIIPDATKNSRFENSPLVQKDPKIRFYAAVPLISPHKYTLGVLCVIDYVPREISSEQLNILKILARQVTVLIETRFYKNQAVKYTNEREKSRHLEDETFHDALTGLANRNFFIEKANLAIVRSQEFAFSLFAVLYIHLNRFESVNERLEQRARDKLLIAVASRIKTAVRLLDTVARLGKDEFGVLLEEIGDFYESIQIAKRIIREIEKPFYIFERTIEISASVGIVKGSSIYRNASELINDAKIAMYQAKLEAEDDYVVFDKSKHL